MLRALAAALCLVLLWALPATARTAVDAPPDSLAAYGYGDTPLRGTYGTADVFIPLPAGAVGRSATIGLDLDPSPLLVGSSTFTLEAGGVPVTTVRLAGGDPATRVEVTVPADRIGEDGLALGFRGYLRLTEEDCEEADNPGQYVTVLDSSTVVFDVSRADVVVADAPDLFDGPPGDGVVGFALAGRDEATLQAAATAAWQVGRWRGAANARPWVTADAGALPDSAARVVIGTADALPAQGGVPLPRDVAGPLLAVANVAGPTLLVTGAQPGDLPAAAAALARPADLASMGSTAARLTGRSAVAAPDRSAPWTGEITTLAQLGYDRQVVVGSGSREVFLPIDRPAGWTITDDVTVQLDLDASAGLDPQTSTVQLLVGGVDAGTRRLADEPGPQRHTFTVPPGLLDRTLDGQAVRQLDLSVRMVLDLPEDICSAPEVGAAQVAVLPTTAIEVPHDDAGTLELGRFPHPLDGPDGEQPVTLLVPADPEPDEVEALLQAAAALGRWARAGAQPPVVAIGELPQPAEGDGGVVVLGDRAADIAGVDVPAAPAPSAGGVQARMGLVDDVQGRVGLVLLGDLATGARALADRDVLQRLAGEVAVLQADAPVVLADGTLALPPPELAPADRAWFERSPDYLIPAVTVGAALLGILLLVVLLRWRPMTRRG